MMELRNSGAESQSLDRSQSIQKTDGDGSKIVGEHVEVGNAGAAAQVVKRKRGRPPRAQANQPSAKKMKEEDEEEDVCFICFDGGSLVLCDRRGCPKAYHPACIKRDEAFFRSKAKWNCGWHICSMCEKTAYHMCYTCTYSLCKGCIKKADYVCVRGDKGFCTVCMKTIMLIENSGDAKAQVDFDDKTSWEYLFKVYWVYLKGKLSLTFNELTQASNPWKRSSTIGSIEPTETHISASGRRSITSDLAFGNIEANESQKRKTHEQANGLPKEWASRELLDFVSHMKNGDTSVLSQFDVQALLLEYIKRNNLRDPRKKTQIICDLRLMNLFGKPRVGHIEMLKLLEFHFLIKEDQDPQKNTINSTANEGETDCKIDNNNNNMVVVMGNKERRNHRKGEQRTTQNKLDDYAAIDVHNMNLIYLRRNLMESLIEDSEKFNEKVVGSIVQIRISGSDQKDDMYRLVQVVGTTKVDVPYKIGDKSVDVMLEVLNLDKKETVSIDTISNQELSEDECRRLRESIRCGLVRCFTVAEIQEKAMALQSVLLDDRMQTEMQRLNHLRDRASEKGQKKGVRECAQKLKLLKTPEERERRLQEIPEVHSDPKMNPDYESDDTEEYFNNEHGEHPKPKFPWASGTNTISPQKRAESVNDQPKDLVATTLPNVKEDSSKATEVSNAEKDVIGLTSSGGQQNEIDCNGSAISKSNPEVAVSSSVSNIASESKPSFLSMMNNSSVNDNMWHYRDPSGNVQGPFPMVKLQEWSINGYFPDDMRIWAGREADSLLLNNVLQEHFHNHEGRWAETIACDNNVVSQVESVTVCSAIPSSTIPATSYALNTVNLEKIPDSVNCDIPSVASLTKSNESTEQFGNQTQSMLDINQHVSSVFTVTDAALVDLPNPLLKKETNENEKIQDSGVKEESKLLVQESGDPPNWSTTLSLVVGGSQLPGTSDDEWGRYPPTVSVSSLKPVEVFDHQVATTSSTIDQITSLPSWHGLGETIEFSTLAEESVSDLLAEVDAMESRNGVPSPTSRRNSFLEDLFNGSIDDFSPTADQGTRSDGFSSTADIQLSRPSTGLQFSFGIETKPAVSIPQTTNTDNMGFKWADMGASELQPPPPPPPLPPPPPPPPPPRQDMIDLNDSTRAEADEGERETVIEEKSKSRTVVMAEAHVGRKSKEREGERIKAEIAGTKLVRVFPEVEEEEGEFIQPEATPPPPPPPPPLLPLPRPLPPPPPLTMGLDVVDSRRGGSGRSSQGTTSTGRVHAHASASASRSGNVGRDLHHRRSSGGGGDRYNSSSNSPRERGHHVEDSGYSRSSRASWSRQSSFSGGGGSGGSGSGSGSGYSRPPSKGQRVCKFYESGRCKKGSACGYLHPQDR